MNKTNEQNNTFNSQSDKGSKSSFADLEKNKTQNLKKDERSGQGDDAKVANAKEESAKIISEEEFLKIKQENEKLAQMNSRLQFSMATVQNDAKISEKRSKEKAKYAVSGMAKDFTSVFQSLFLALKSISSDLRDKNNDLDKFAKGIDITMKLFEEAFEKHKLKIINPAVGDVFDGNIHEAVSGIPDVAPKDSILNVMQVGLVLEDRLLIPAKVTISFGQVENTEEDTDNETT